MGREEESFLALHVPASDCPTDGRTRIERRRPVAVSETGGIQRTHPSQTPNAELFHKPTGFSRGDLTSVWAVSAKTRSDNSAEIEVFPSGFDRITYTA